MMKIELGEYYYFITNIIRRMFCNKYQILRTYIKFSYLLSFFNEKMIF